MSVYFICDEHRRVKIGWANDPVARRNSLQPASADRLQIIRVIAGCGLLTEQWLHKNFSALRLHSEWFKFADVMLTISPPKEIDLEQRRDATNENKDEQLELDFSSKDILDTKQMSAWFGLSPHWFKTRRKHGDGPPFEQRGRVVLYRKSSVLAWLDERTVGGTEEHAETPTTDETI
jgi:hypothetical protein